MLKGFKFVRAFSLYSVARECKIVSHPIPASLWRRGLIIPKMLLHPLFIEQKPLLLGG